MTALVIETPLDRTGVGRYTRYLIEVFDDMALDYEILDFSGSVKHTKVVYNKRIVSKLSYLLVCCGFRDIYVNNRYSMFVFPTASSLSVLMRGRKIVAVHDLMHKFYKFREVYRFDIRFYRDSLYKSLAKSNATVVVDSKVGVEHWIRFYGRGNDVRAIPFYASLVRDKSKSSTLIKELGLDSYLFYPAAFWSHKNHINLVKAVKELVTHSDLTFKIVFCGKPNAMLVKIKDEINKLNLGAYFEILDFISDDDLVELYVNSKGLIYPSYFGPTNIPPLEAISLNVPIAVSNVFEPKNIYGRDILTFDPDNIQEISMVCKLLLCSEKAFLGSSNNEKDVFIELWSSLIDEN